jgi:hypothetical protein
MDSLQFMAIETIVKSALDLKQLARLKDIINEQEKRLKHQQRNRYWLDKVEKTQSDEFEFELASFRLKDESFEIRDDRRYRVDLEYRGGKLLLHNRGDCILFYPDGGYRTWLSTGQSTQPRMKHPTWKPPARLIAFARFLLNSPFCADE